MKHKLLLLYSWFVRTLLIWLPDVPFIMRFRGWLYGLGMRSCGKNFQVAHSASLQGVENFIVGCDAYFANQVIVLASTTIRIEDEVMIGPNSVLVTGNHTLYNGSFRYASAPARSIFLRRGAWVAANCTVLAGAILPEGSVLSANSCLHSIKDEMKMLKYSVYGGNPARIIKSIL